MKNVSILAESATLVLGKEHDDMRALGIMSLISTLAKGYGTEGLYSFIDRIRCAVETGCYAILYERVDATSPIWQPVGYITWGLFSKPTEVVFKERLRPLQEKDFKSGGSLWVIDLVAPLGHGEPGLRLFEELFPDHPEYQATRWRGPKLTPTTFHNKTRRKAQKE